MTTARRRRQPAVRPGPFPFTYDEFEEWYQTLTAGLLEPARVTFTRILNSTLDQELSDVDRLRIRVSHSRVKSPSRLWNKMLSNRYVESLTELDAIPSVIDDLVGVRVTCNNLVDVETFRNIVIALSPTDDTEMPAGLCIDPESERNHNKPSGYRAYHINLHTLIPDRNSWTPARGELQVRTLLQDSWGELTHEDTYKPGSHMPQLVTQLAKRMADLLATVDDLAQDLRNELDSLAARDVGAPDPTRQAPIEQNAERAQADAAAASNASANVREALLAEARRVVRALTRPAPLAQVAWQVQANFGREVTADWGGFGSFKELLRAAAPEAHIVEIPPGTVVPAGLPSGVSYTENPETVARIGSPPEGVPAVVYRLKQRDSGVPAVPSERLSALLDAVVGALDGKVWVDLGLTPSTIGIRELNQLTKYARGLATNESIAPSRASLDYTLKSLHFSQNLRPDLDKSTVASIVEGWLFARASRLGYVLDPDTDREEMADWIASAL